MFSLHCPAKAEFFGFSSWAKPCLALPGSEHMEAPLIYPDVLHAPETLSQDSPTASGLRFWVQNYTFHSGQFGEKSRGATVLAAFHWSQILTLSNFPAMPREKQAHTTATGSPQLPSDQAQLTRRSQGQGGSLLWTTSTAWLWPLPRVGQSCCSCPRWHEVGCKCYSHRVPKDGKITITHMYMHLHFEYLTRQLFMGKIFWSIYTLKHKIWFSS